jgi:hypothetical protein
VSRTEELVVQKATLSGLKRDLLEEARAAVAFGAV